MMQRRDVILTAVFASIAALILIAGLAGACFYIHKRRRKRDEDEEESTQVVSKVDGNAAVGTSQEKKSKLNGFLSLKTPLISSKTLG